MTTSAKTLFVNRFLDMDTMHFIFDDSYISKTKAPYSDKVFTMALKPGGVAATIDNNKMRLLIVGTSLGNFVVYERVQRDIKNEAINSEHYLFAEESIQLLTLGTLDNNLNDKDMLAVIGDGGVYGNIGQRLESLRKIMRSPKHNATQEVERVVCEIAAGIAKVKK